jgi:acyl carrier protein
MATFALPPTCEPAQRMSADLEDNQAMNQRRPDLPTGTPNICPKCRGSIRRNRAVVAGRVICPHCGIALWGRANFGYLLGIRTNRRGALFFDAKEVEQFREKVIDLIATKTMIDRECLRERIALEDLVGADSLDIVELTMKIEDEINADNGSAPPVQPA